MNTVQAQNAFIMACTQGGLNIVRYMITDNALQRACATKQIGVIIYLLSEGASV